ncbi:MAG: YceI family protein [Bacteroidia bacterium]
MKKYILILLLIAGIGFTAFKNLNTTVIADTKTEQKIENPIGTQITYDADVTKSTFFWHGKKVTGEHSGTVKIMKGAIYRNKGMFNGGEVEIDMTSIADTDITNAEYKEKLEKHLKAESFFDVAKFPTATFKIKRWSPIKEAKTGSVNYNVTGDLTIKGITKEITFPAIANLNDKTVTASAEFNIDRTDYGLKYQSIKFDPGIGDKMIYDEFNIKINLVATTK